MTQKLFDFEEQFKFGIDEVDSEHIILVDMLNRTQELLNQNKRDEALEFFSETLSLYVHEHFENEEAFMASFDYPDLDKHKTIHSNFRHTVDTLKPKIAKGDNAAFRQALRDTYMWVVSHIGTTDREYVTYYLKQKNS